MSRAGRAAAAGLLLALAACSSSPPAPEPSPVPFSWREAALALATGVSGAPMVRDAVLCGDDWFVVGGVRDAGGGTRPAAWLSRGGEAAWAPVPVQADSFYGRQNVLFTVACRGGRLAAVGAKPGGAHGNPRVSSWARADDGVLREVSAPFELYGGPKAVNVSRLAAGPQGFLIAGNRASGAAVWSSVDAAGFAISEGAPGLASDAAGLSWAADAVAASGGWLVVGGWLPVGRSDRDPAGWSTGADGRWRRLAAEGATAEYEELQRVALVGGAPVAVGVRGPVFGVWRLESQRWRPVASFGSVRASAWSGARAVAVSGSRLLVVAGDGSAYGLWVSDDGGARWRRGVLPVAAPGVAGSAVSVASGPGLTVLVLDDGVTGRVFTSVTAG